MSCGFVSSFCVFLVVLCFFVFVPFSGLSLFLICLCLGSVLVSFVFSLFSARLWASLGLSVEVLLGA